MASIDLSGYEFEQAKLMDERCIIVDENDKPLGALDKKTRSSTFQSTLTAACP